MYMYSLDNYMYVVFPFTGTLSFLTLYSPSTVTRGDEDYGGRVSTGGGFEFGNGYIYSVYVSTVQKDTCVHINASVDVMFSNTCVYCVYMYYISSCIYICRQGSYPRSCVLYHIHV